LDETKNRVRFAHNWNDEILKLQVLGIAMLD